MFKICFYILLSLNFETVRPINFLLFFTPTSVQIGAGADRCLCRGEIARNPDIDNTDIDKIIL